MIAAPALIPAKPLGAKPPCAGSVQLWGFTRKTPTAMKKRRIPTLSSTIALLVSADSLTPMTRITVITATERNAGRLAMIGTPNRCGAAPSAEARYTVLGSDAPEATAWTAIAAERGSVASQAGMLMPKWLTSSTKYPAHPIATPMFPTAYSMIKSQPMIQATNSPSDAYAYVYADPATGTIAANSA